MVWKGRQPDGRAAVRLRHLFELLEDAVAAHHLRGAAETQSCSDKLILFCFALMHLALLFYHPSFFLFLRINNAKPKKRNKKSKIANFDFFFFSFVFRPSNLSPPRGEHAAQRRRPAARIHPPHATPSPPLPSCSAISVLNRRRRTSR